MVFHRAMPSPEPAVSVGGAPRLLRLPSFPDARGLLVAADAGRPLPFAAARCFFVRDVPAGAVRARHAQRDGEELLCCVAGACTVELRWHTGHTQHRLADPTAALYLPPWVWLECRDFSAEAVLAVLCSRPYDPLDQITDLAEFEAGAG